MQKKTQGFFLIIIILLSILVATPKTFAVESTTSTTEHMIRERPLTNISLQEMINNAAPGEILQLPSITFTEVLTIDKPLHLRGEGPIQTVLQPTSAPNGYAIQITAEGVILSNLTIMNHADGLYTTALKITAENTTIEHCVFQHTPIGIAIWSSKNTITNCVFQDCTDEGIVLLGTPASACTNNTIASCLFIENCDGIELQYATYTQIVLCNFTRNTHAGIDAIESDNDDNIISECTFIDNSAFGLYLARSSQNLITKCSFTNDALMLVHSMQNTLHNSQIKNIHLLDESSLLLDQCINATTDHIITEQSTFEIRTHNQEQTHTSENVPIRRYHQILISLLSHLKTLQTFIAQFSTARM